MNDLKKLLYKLVDVIVEEAEENPAFKAKIENVLTGGNPVIPPKEIDLVEMYKADEGASLTAYLKKNNMNTCKELAISSGITMPQKLPRKKDDLIKCIVSACEEAASQKAGGAPDSDIQKEDRIDIVSDETIRSGEASTDPSLVEDSNPVSRQDADDIVPASNISRTDTDNIDPVTINPPTDVDDINPVKIYRKEGPKYLESLLGLLSVDDLHRIIRNNGMDTARRSVRWKNTTRLIELIMSMAKNRATQGDVFLNYKS